MLSRPLRPLRLTRLAGIDVRVDPSLLLFALLVSWVFGASFLERHALPTAVVMAGAATTLFLASVLVHELAHGLEARYRGIQVQGITLFFFGGMTEMRADSQSPKDEFAVSAVGPYASLVCGAVFGLVATLAAVTGDALAGPVSDVAGLLAWLNVFLAAFNLIPGAPLDGGRVLRAGLWWLLRDRHRAVRIAGRAGQLLAAALAAAGLWLALQAPGARLFGIVLAMVGAFIFQAARADMAQGDLERILDQRSVGEVLGEPPAPVAPGRPLDLVDPGPGDRLLLVVDDGTVLGTLPGRRVRDLHPADRAARSVEELMDRAGDLPEVAHGASLRELVDLLLGDADTVVVRDGSGPFAALREADVARALDRLRRDRRASSSAAAPPREGVGG